VLDPPAVASQSKYLSDVLDIVDKVTKILALFIGAAWAYLNYLRGRTFKRRLEPAITGKTIRTKGVLLLSGVAQAKNVGLSKVAIQQRGTAIEVLAIVNRLSEERPALGTQDVAVLSVFEVHGWIEPGEVIEESFLVPVAEHPEILAFRLRLRIVSEGIEWNCDSVVEVVAGTGTEGGQPIVPDKNSGDLASRMPVPARSMKAEHSRAGKE
jgi:hypothetical protein